MGLTQHQTRCQLRHFGAGAFGCFLMAGVLACAPVPDAVAPASVPTQQAEPARNISLPSLPFGQRMASIEALSQRQGESVTVAGDVRRQVPLVAGQLYQLQDNTGSVWVVVADGNNTTEASAIVGSRVTVQGTVLYEEIQINGSNLSEYYIQADRVQIEPAPTN